MSPPSSATSRRRRRHAPSARAPPSAAAAPAGAPHALSPAGLGEGETQGLERHRVIWEEEEEHAATFSHVEEERKSGPGAFEES